MARGFELVTDSFGRKHEDFGSLVALGYFERILHIDKFGFNPDIDGSNETVWDVGGLYPYPGSALTMTVASAAGAADAGVQVEVQGLDENWLTATQTGTLDASGSMDLGTDLIRTFRAKVTGSQAPTDVVTVANGGTTYAQIADGENQTLMALFTIPADCVGLLKSMTVSTAGANGPLTTRLAARPFGGVFQTKDKFILASGGALTREHRIPLVLEPKTDIEVRGSGGTNLDASATFEIDLYKFT